MSKVGIVKKAEVLDQLYASLIREILSTSSECKLLSDSASLDSSEYTFELKVKKKKRLKLVMKEDSN